MRSLASSAITLRESPRPSAEESRRDARYPISRWWLRPMAVRLAGHLAATWVRPGHFTLLNLLSIAGAVLVLCLRPDAPLAAAGFVLLGWFFDRLDGALARAQQSASATGAWLDGNIDELGDLALHAAMAYAASAACGSIAWLCYGAFLFGKYLLMYGMQAPEGSRRKEARAANPANNPGLLRTLYHLPANADVRVHLALAALVAAAWNPVWLAVELALIAAYYNLRWIARYALVLGRGA